MTTPTILLHPTMNLVQAAAVLIAFLSSAVVLPARQAAPVFRSSSREVLLDVVVTDSAGRPILGLDQRQFTVLENGVRQSMKYFKAPAPSEPFSETKARTAILLDELNLQFEDLAYARSSIVQFLKPHTVLDQPMSLMIIGPRGLALKQAFTTDSSLVQTSLNSLPPVLNNTALAAEHANAALGALEQIARASVGYSFRLNVVWFTNGFRGVAEQVSPSQDLDSGLRSIERSTCMWIARGR